MTSGEVRASTAGKAGQAEGGASSKAWLGRLGLECCWSNKVTTVLGAISLGEASVRGTGVAGLSAHGGWRP